MNTLTKQTVCIANEETKKQGYNVPKGFIGKYGYFFTPEQLNKYVESIIKQTLQIAADKAYSYAIEGEGGYMEGPIESIIVVESITNTFEETYQKFKV